MKIDIEKIYIVMEPYPAIEDFEEIFVDASRNLGDLYDLFNGGIDVNDIFGIYTDRESAFKDAEKLWQDLQNQKGFKPNKSQKQRFGDFIDELEILSNKHNIAIQSIGGVFVFEEPMIINYDPDETSGDLIASWKEPL